MLSNKIASLQKQNHSIYSSLVSKNIQFEKTTIAEGIDDDEHLKLLEEENTRLKEVSKANKPPQRPIEKQEKQEKQENQEKQEKPDNKNNEEDDNETFEEPIKKFDTITNMEEMKRAFFGGYYGVFEEQLKAHQFKLYNVSYKYNSDKDNAPEFSAKNLLKGFVRNFDDYRKYFMICFRCWKLENENKYKYESFWIVNTHEPINNIIGSMWEDFEFNETIDIDIFNSSIKKLPETDEPVFTNGYTCIGESYVH